MKQESSQVAVRSGFYWNGVELRTMVDEDGKSWFVAKDVAQALGYSEETISNMNKTIGMGISWRGTCRRKRGNHTLRLRPARFL